MNFSSSNSSSNYLVMSHEEPSAVGPEKASSVTFNFEKMEKTPLQQQRFHILRYLARNFSIILSKILIFFGENNCRNNIIIVVVYSFDTF